MTSICIARPCFRLSTPTVHARKPSRLAIVPRAESGTSSSVGSYLAKAAEHIFHPLHESDVPWSRSAEAFSGGITHHEDPTKMRALYEIVKSTRAAIEGCTDAGATNYDPNAVADDGSCTYTFETDAAGEVETEDGSLQQYVINAIERVFGHNFKGDGSEPARYYSTGYSAARGRRSSRALQRDVDRLRRFEGLLEKAMEKGDE